MKLHIRTVPTSTATLALLIALGLAACDDPTAGTTSATASAKPASTAPEKNAADKKAETEPAGATADDQEDDEGAKDEGDGAGEETEGAAEKAKAKIGETSITDASTDDVSAALEEAGWQFKSSGGMAMGATKTTTIKAEKDGLQAKITLIQPSGKDESGSMKMAKAADQEKDFADEGAAYLEGNTLVAVTIEGKKDEAQKLLDALVKKPE